MITYLNCVKIGILCKLRHFVSTDILVQVYYSIIYPYLTYAPLVWGHTYESNLNPLIILQKKAVRTMSFSAFRDHTSPLFKTLNLLKFLDIGYISTASFMFENDMGILPADFENFFILSKQTHEYSTRMATSNAYVIPQIRTNYGLFNIRFCGPKIWNSIAEPLKKLCLKTFKKKTKREKNLILLK